MSLASNPMLAVSGEVGCLAEENAQRLISIFIEAAMSCLGSMRDVVDSKLRAGGKIPSQAATQQLYASCLATVRTWSIDTLHDEIAQIEAMYPETQKLHQFVVVSVLSEAVYAEGMTSMHVPPVGETYHVFLKRVASSSDVQRLSFFELTLCQRRVVFLEAFRNAFHDIARRCATMRPELTVSAAARASRRSEAACAFGAQAGAAVEREAASGSFARADGTSFAAQVRYLASTSSASANSEVVPSKSRLEQAMLLQGAAKRGARSEGAPASEAPATGAGGTPKDSRAVLLLDTRCDAAATAESAGEPSAPAAEHAEGAANTPES